MFSQLRPRLLSPEIFVHLFAIDEDVRVLRLEWQPQVPDPDDQGAHAVAIADDQDTRAEISARRLCAREENQ